MNGKSLLFTVLVFLYSGCVFSQPPQGNCIAAPELKVSGNRTITVNSVRQLFRAVNKAPENTTIVVKPGLYRLTSTISVTTDNLTIRGLDNRCDQVILLGNGMDNKDHRGVTSGFWINAKNTTIANMTIGEVYHHPIQVNGAADAPRIYNVRMVNAGQQFIKSNPLPSGQGVNNGIVEYSVMDYTDGAPKTDHDGSGIGYTQGVDVHGGSGWRISNNKFVNFHTPDTADHLWNPAILMWRGSSHTITENNLFINVDRAIAYGLNERSGSDHRGGVIRNNVVFMSPDLYSDSRRWAADAAIILWDSPGAKVLHNTILTNGNTPFAIESRFNNSGVVFENNLTDAPIVHSAGGVKRSVCKFSLLCRDYRAAYQQKNEIEADAVWFFNPGNGALQLLDKARASIPPVRQHPDAVLDFHGVKRPASATPGAVQ